MSYMDQRRDPVPPPDMATVDARQPGTSGAPATQYQPLKSAGHKRPADREVARRRQVEISAQSGAALDSRMAQTLQRIADDPTADGHHARKDMAMGVACGAHCRAADDHAGYLSTGGDEFTRLRGPQEQLRHLFTGK